MDTSKSGFVWLGIAALLLVAVIAAIPFGLGMAIVRLFPLFKRLEFVLAALCIAALPLAFFRQTSRIPFLLVANTLKVFCIGLWMLSFVMVYELWGPAGAMVGLILGGLGVIPLAVVAALVHVDGLLLTAFAISAAACGLALAGSGILLLKANSDRYP